MALRRVEAAANRASRHASVRYLLLHCYGLCATFGAIAARRRRACRGATTMTAPEWEETPIGACTRDPERWTSTADAEAKAICRACPRRWLCARDACEFPRAEGLWAGSSSPRAAAAGRLPCASCVPSPSATATRCATGGCTPSPPDPSAVRRRCRGGRRRTGGQNDQVNKWVVVVVVSPPPSSMPVNATVARPLAGHRRSTTPGSGNSPGPDQHRVRRHRVRHRSVRRAAVHPSTRCTRRGVASSCVTSRRAALKTGAKTSPRFDDSDIGHPVEEWPGERWLDTRSPNVREIMRGRLDLARLPRAAMASSPTTSMPICSTRGSSWMRRLNSTSIASSPPRHTGAASPAGLKNDLDQIPELVTDFDFAVNEQCFEYTECEPYADFVMAGKPVFNAEYAEHYRLNEHGERDALCRSARAAGMRTLVLARDLDDSLRFACD